MMFDVMILVMEGVVGYQYCKVIGREKGLDPTSLYNVDPEHVLITDLL